MINPATASAVIDWEAHRANLTALSALATPSQLMAVVKADGYGHGLIEAARSARKAGAQWIGAAVPGEALAVRASGDTGRVLCWLYGPGQDFTELVANDIDVSASSVAELAAVRRCARHCGRVARVHLKIDTGLSRNGCPAELWPELCEAAADAVRAGVVEVVAVWTHLATAEEPEHPAVAAQLAAFDAAVEVARAVGHAPLRHVANSAGAMLLSQARYDIVRVGIAGYGVEPAPGVAARAGITLQPVMTLRCQLVQVKRLTAGAGVSYGHTWIAPRDTTVGLVPLGYADGIFRCAGNRAVLQIGGREVPIVGRVCMDQCVVDLGHDARDRVGDEVIVFGDGGQSANDLAEACGTIGYEIVTRIGNRVPRVSRNG